MTELQMVEAGSVVAGSGVGGRKFRARLIEGDVLGSSGYYPRAVIERDGPVVFPKGTHVYVDHPTESEKFDRPERSIRDLAGRIASTPVYEGDGLYADVEVIPSLAPMVESLMDDIGMSIRARGTYEPGTVNGEQVKMITSLTSSESVDFVTKPGAGGRITALLESVRELSEATSNDTRDAIQSALSDRFGGTDSDAPWVWLRDFDDTTAWYAINDQTYQIGYTLGDDNAATLDPGQPVEVNAKTTYVPVSSAGGSTDTQEATTGVTMEITEAEHRRLTEAATALAEANKRAEAAEAKAAASDAKIAESEARTDAATRAKTLLESVEVRDATKARIVESVIVGLPMSDGKLDVAAFEARVKERATSEATYEAALLAEAGVGRVSGEGGGKGPTDTTEATKVLDEANKVLADFYKGQGLSEAEVNTAVTGRG